MRFCTYKSQFQSTLPVRGATGENRPSLTNLEISIHAPREGSDMLDVTVVVTGQVFQSTLPVRGATRWPMWSAGAREDFNPRSP